MDVVKPTKDAPIYEGEQYTQSAGASTSQLQPHNNGPAATASISALGRGRPSFTTSTVQRDHVDLILFACALCSGLIDGSMIVAYTTFVGPQST